MKPMNRGGRLLRSVATLVTMVIGIFSAGRGVSADQNHRGAATQSDRFKLYVEDSGVYAVSYDDLVQAGLQLRAVPSRGIGITNQGETVPLWIEDGGDGIFESGDRVIFVGSRLLGDYSFLDEYSRFNCYVLDINVDDPLRGGDIRGGWGGDELDQPAELFVKSRVEEDTVMVRYPERPNEPQERWYWSRLSVADREPFRIALTIEGIRRGVDLEQARDAFALRELTVVGATGDETREHLEEIFGSTGSEMGTLSLQIGFRGWSKPRNSGGLPHHEVAISTNGNQVSLAQWDGTDPFTHQVEVPITDASSGRLEMEISVPRRLVPETEDLLVDVVLLNWIEAEFLRDNNLGEGQGRFGVLSEGDNDFPPLEVVAGGDGWLYGAGTQRAEVLGGSNRIDGQVFGEGPIFPVIGDTYRSVDQITADHHSNLRGNSGQIDYIMITHQKLMESVEPLAEFHKKNGLTVVVVDIEDIYDEFNHGIQHPRSIRDFLSWAYEHWPKPTPRFVLMAGDASWDYKNLTADDARYADWTFRPGESVRFIKNSSSSYESKAGINHRNLVPTWGYRTSQGHAASDNWFVSIDGDDIYPDMAIGRIAVAEPEEMAAVVRKTIAYVEEGVSGQWQKDLLFITNESLGFQRASDTTAGVFEGRGYSAQKIYPNPEEAANEEHTENMVGAFDHGLLMVQFLGHGGRYIWRTGPPDLKKNHDLFTLDHLDTLEPNGKIPFVVSLTCYSAPFDHPTADSIGEKLLRLDGKGAIGVFAASWRNSPSSDMGRIVMNELTTPGATIGEALMRAKRQLRSPTLVETYNLLGDPAISLNVAPDVQPPSTPEAAKPTNTNKGTAQFQKPISAAKAAGQASENGEHPGVEADGKDK